MELNTEQKRVAESTAKHIIVKAGPGSGKTATLVQRVLRMIRDGIDPKSIVVMTFTRKAAGELERRLGIELGFIGTIHAFCLRFLQAQNPELVVLSEEQANVFMEEACAGLKVKPSKVSKLKPLFNPSTVNHGDSMERVVLGNYCRTLKINNLIDYDGILNQGQNLIPDGLHLLVDEFQDTSSAEQEIYDQDEWASRFFVGDPDQMIYEWRGCDPDLFRDYWHQFSRADYGEALSMVTNYRCSQDIQKASRECIEHPRLDHEAALRILDKWVDVDVVEGEAMQCTDFEGDETIGVLCRYNSIKDNVCNALDTMGVEYTVQKQGSVLDELKEVLSGFIVQNDRMLTKSIEKVFGSDFLRTCKDYSREEVRSLRDVVLNSDPGKQVIGAMDRASAMIVVHLVYDRSHQEAYKAVMTWLMNLPESSSWKQILSEIEQENPVSKGSRVQVLTIHQAKGLEFDRVIIPEFNEEGFPLRKDECKRLLYVALTRARNRVQLFV